MQGQTDVSIALIDSTVDFLENDLFNDAQKMEALINLARFYIDAGDVLKSRSLIEQSLQYLYNTEYTPQMSRLIQEAIAVSFILGPDGVDLLQETIRIIYTIRDYQQRTDLLLDTAQKYQEESEGQRTNVLLQQAIPSAISIENPLYRTHAYSLLGLLFTEEDQRAALTYSRKTLAMTEDLLLHTEADEIVFMEIISNFAKSGFPNEALTLIDLISIPRLKIETLTELAHFFYQQEQFSEVDVLLDRVFTILEEKNQPDLTISTLLNVSRIYSDAGETETALSHINDISNYQPLITDTLQADQFLLETSRRYAELGNEDQAISSAEKIRDPASLALAYMTIASIRLAAPEENPAGGFTGEITALLEKAEQAEQVLELEAELEPGGLPVNKLLGDLAALHAWAGNTEQALELVTRMTDPYYKALGIASIYRRADPNEITDEFIEPYLDGLNPSN